MKVLRANKTIDGYSTIKIETNKIILKGKIIDYEFNKLNESITRAGLIYPIIIMKKEKMYECVTGNQRLKYALDNNFDFIDCIIINNISERKNILTTTYISPTNYENFET